jgi:hypothetical protein
MHKGAKIMKVTTYEGTVENGCVHLLGSVLLPEKAKVYIVVPDIVEVEAPPLPRIRSPRLADPSQAALFEMVVTKEETPNG